MSLSSDVFSYGMILWEIVTGKLPLHDVPERKVSEHIVDGKVSVIEKVLMLVLIVCN